MDDVAVFIVTFKRDASLRRVLESVAEQTLHTQVVLVVDNASSPRTAAVCADPTIGVDVRYLAASNGGPAGGTALAMQRLVDGPPVEWMLRIDDDRPLPSPTFLEAHVAAAEQLRRADDRTGIVGCDGAVWDWRHGRLRPRPVDLDLAPVDYVRTGFYPLYRTAMVREVGVFRSELFFGMTEVEYGLRVQEAGWKQWAVGTEIVREPQRSSIDDWRRYYSIRNTVVILSEQGHTLVAWRQGLFRGVIRPLLSAWRSPRSAWRGLRLGGMALRDARRRRMGLVVDPAASPVPGGRPLDEMPVT